MSGPSAVIFLVFLQFVLIVLVAGGLKVLMERELFTMALEHVRGLKIVSEVVEVSVITAGDLRDDRRAALARALKEKFPQADPKFLVNSACWGGLVIDANGKIMDFTALSRVKQLFGGASWAWRS